MARVYNLVETNFKRPQLFARDSDLEKFSKVLGKKFPDSPDNLAKEKAFELFNKRAPEIVASLKDYYCTFLELVNFSEESWKLLSDLAAVSQEYKLELNVDVMTYYFNLLIRYVQVQILMNQIDTPQNLLSCYARAFHHTSGNTEPNTGRIAKYLATFRPNPIQQIQKDCSSCNISLSVGNTVINWYPLLAKWSTVTSLVQNKAFNILEEPKQMLINVGEKNHFELLQIEKLRNFTLWSFLICPAELARPQALDLLQLCLKQEFVVPIFREKVLDIHEQFEETFENFKMPSSSSGNKFKLSNHKKVLKEAYAEPQETIKHHLEMRSYLQLELNTLLTFFSDVPHVLAPKLQMIFALLHLARDEVVWYFRHLHVTPYKGKKKEEYVVYDAAVSGLIYGMSQMTKLIEANKKSIQTYYLEWMTKVDYPAVKAASDAFLATSSNNSISQLIQLILQFLPNRSTADNFEAIRLHWYRISASFNNTQSGIPIHSTVNISSAMNNLITHTRHIDCIDTQIKSHCSFMLLFFYRNDLNELLKEVMKGHDSGSSQATHVMSFIELLNHSLHNVHRLCPDEQFSIGKDAVTTADSFIRQVVQNIEKHIGVIQNETIALRSKTNHSSIIQRMGLAGGAQTLNMPGAESLLENRSSIANLALSRKIVSDICSSFLSMPIVTIYNIEFVPREYLYEALTTHLRGTILSLCVSGAHIQKPTVILNRLRDTTYSYEIIERILNIRTNDIVRDVMLGEFAGEEVAPAANPVATSSTTASGSTSVQAGPADGVSGGSASSSSSSSEQRSVPIIKHIASWFCNLLSLDVSRLNITFSALKRCYVSKPVTNDIEKALRSQSKDSSNSNAQQTATSLLNFLHLQVERFSDVTELRALATLAGPAGIAVIERGLMRIVSIVMKTIKEVAVQNQNHLLQLAGRFSEQNVFAETVPNLNGLDSLCVATTIMGSIFHFRQLLKSALYDVVKNRSYYVSQAVELAYNQVHCKLLPDARFATLDNAACDIGIDLHDNDPLLRHALQPFKTGVGDVALWNLLPELFGVMYLSQRWKQSSYQIESEGHTNNAHTIALAVRLIMGGLNRVQIKTDVNATEIEAKIQSDFERFVRCSSYCILHMHSSNNNSNQKSSSQDVGYPIPSIMLFLELFILSTKGRLDLSFLESCFPFTMLRTNYIQLYEKQTTGYAFAPVADEDTV